MSLRKHPLGAQQQIPAHLPRYLPPPPKRIQKETSNKTVITILPDTSSTGQIVLPRKEKIIFQPSMFMGYVSFRETNTVGTFCYPVAPCIPQKRGVSFMKRKKGCLYPSLFCMTISIMLLNFLREPRSTNFPTEDVLSQKQLAFRSGSSSLE